MVEKDPAQKAADGSGRRYPLLAFLLLLALVLVGWLLKELLRPYYVKARRIVDAYSNSRTLPADAISPELTLAEIASLESELKRGRGGDYIVHRFPSWQFNDFSQISSNLKLLNRIGDSSPPPGEVWSYTATGRSIEQEYRLLLQEALSAAQDRIQFDSRRQELLAGTNELRSAFYRRVNGIPEPVKARARSNSKTKPPPTLLDYVSFVFSELPDIPEAGNAWADFVGRPPGPLLSLSDAEVQMLTNTEATSGPELRRSLYAGGILLREYEQDGKSREISAQTQLWGTAYRLIALQRASWFHVALVRQAKAVGTVLPRFQRYFGAEGGLARLPLALIVRRESELVITIDDAQQVCIVPRTGKRVEFGVGLEQLSLPCEAAVRAEGGLLWTLQRKPRLTLVGLVSEKM